MNKATNNTFVQNLTGVAKKNAKNGLENATSAMDNFKNTSTVFKALQNNIGSTSDKIKNVEGHLPGNIVNKVNDAKNNVDYLLTKNKTILEKGQQQGIIKNLLDKSVKSARNEVNNAQRNLGSLIDEKSKLKNSMLTNLNINLDKNVADLNKFKTISPDYNDLKKKISDSQSAYDKALRSTKKTRTAVVGGATATGYGVHTLKKSIKSRKAKQEEEQPLEYIY